MLYLIGLFAVLAMIFSITTGTNLIGDFFGSGEILSSVKNKVSETIFPKTAKEIIIDNIDSDYQSMGKFFSETVPTLLKSETVSATDKATIQKAVEAFNGSKSSISNLAKLEKEDKGLVKTIVERVLNLSGEKQPDPTSIPSQCHLECPSN